MSEYVLSSSQREILEALTRHWELLQWRCNDGTHRWHLGEDTVDGRSVRGLVRRGLVEPSYRYVRMDQLVLTDRGREALR